MQLTSAFLQDAADKLGRLLQPGPNIRVGVARLGRSSPSSAASTVR